jgi:transposase-like protein
MVQRRKEKVKRRRTWTDAEKIKLVEETRKLGRSVSDVAQREGVAVSQLYNWGSQMRKGVLQAVQPDENVEAGGVRELDGPAQPGPCTAQRSPLRCEPQGLSS